VKIFKKFLILFLFSVIICQSSNAVSRGASNNRLTSKKKGSWHSRRKKTQELIPDSGIPSEVVEIIFSRLADEPATLVNCHNALLVVAHTCQGWRQIVQSEAFQKVFFYNLIMRCDEEELIKIVTMYYEIIKNLPVCLPPFFKRDNFLRFVVEALPARINGNTDIDVCLHVLALLDASVDENKYFEQAAQIACNLIIHPGDMVVRTSALSLFEKLFNKKCVLAFELAFELVSNNFKHDNLKLRIITLSLLQHLVRYKYLPAFELASKAISENKDHDNLCVRLSAEYLKILLSEFQE